MEEDEDVESAGLTDRPWFVAPLRVQPAQYHDGSGVEEGDCERIIDAEKVIVELRADVERAGQGGI